MSDLAKLFLEQECVLRWKAERENSSARLELAHIYENCAYLISQHDPVAKLEIDRERLRLVLSYVRHGDLSRLDREYQELRIAEIKRNGLKT